MTILMLLAVASTRAQSLEPRFYSNAPVGMNFVLGGYAFSTGAVAVDPSVELENGNLDLHAPFVAYAHSMGLRGKSAKFDMVLPYTFLSGSATQAGVYKTRHVDGIADPLFRFSINFIGAPALTMKQFQDYKQDFVMGASLKVTAPLGQYDSSKLVNIGTHRWSFTPEVGLSKTIGPVLLELAGAVSFYTDNNDFLGQKKEQEPICSLQMHVVYAFRNGMWMALGGTRYTGGRTTVGGVEKSDLQQNSRLGATLALPVGKRNSVKLYASTGVATRTGSDFDTIGIAWQYRWGGGL
ncbi:MAG: transporter [Verrucomicrobiota bacterium]